MTSKGDHNEEPAETTAPSQDRETGSFIAAINMIKESVSVTVSRWWSKLPMIGAKGNTDEPRDSLKYLMYGTVIVVVLAAILAISAGRNKDQTKYQITITTGTAPDQGIVEYRCNAYLRLYAKSGNMSESIQLSSGGFWRPVWRYLLGLNQTSSVYTKFNEDIEDIEIWLERKSDDRKFFWFVETIEIRHYDGDDEQIDIFPVHRWITMRHRMIQLVDSCLPAHDKHPQRRKEDIHLEKNNFYFTMNAANAIPVMKEKSEDSTTYFSRGYYWSVFLLNGTKNTIYEKLLPLVTGTWTTLADTTNIYEVNFLNFSKPKSVDLYQPFLTKMATDSTTKEDWMKFDRVFGALRLNGPNPLVIQRVRSQGAIPNNLNVTDDMLKPHMDGMTILDAIERKRLYMVDYSIILDRILCENGLIASPIALFFVDSNDDLIPVAIQLFKTPSADNPVFLPCHEKADGKDCRYTWLLAKMWFNNADVSYHQSVAHLASTHLIMESILIALRQTISLSHPLHRLMAPHFLYLLNVNNIAWDSLVNDDGLVDTTMTVGVKGMMEIIGRRFNGTNGLPPWRLDVEGNLRNNLQENGVIDHVDDLPKYYFKDDGLMVHDAIRKYVKKVTDHHYKSDDDLEKDNEMQAWIKMLSTSADDGGCGIKFRDKDLQNGQFTNLAQVIDTVTSVISISSVVHAAVNFPQYDNYGYPLHYPAYLNGDPPRSTTTKYTAKDVMQSLSAKSTTLTTMTMSNTLSQRNTNSLGDYETKYQYDAIGKAALKTFRKDLDEISDKIKKRNNDADKHSILGPYDTLDPAHIPNAISI